MKKTVISLAIWAAGGLTFGFTLVTGIICSYLLPRRIWDPWIKKLLRLVFMAVRTTIEVEGREKIDPKKTYLFMANHVSLFDVPLLGAVIPNYVRAVEADRQHKWFLYGWAVRRYGNIPIERENYHRSIQSIKKAARALKNGISIGILPEGHRTLTGALGPFMKLPFFLAKQAEVDIAPIGLSGLFTLKAKHSWHIKPTTVKVKFGDIIPAETVKALSEIELRDLTRERILALIERP